MRSVLQFIWYFLFYFMMNIRDNFLFSKVAKSTASPSCKLLIVGAGAGGCSTAWRFARRLNEHDIIILEPSSVHYNQPLFTLVAAGIKKFSDTFKTTESVLPSCVGWMKDHAEDFDPYNNTVYTRCGDKIVYDYMVVAVGLKNDYEMIPGLKQALDSTCPVTTIYSPEYCKKTWSLIQQFKGGHAVFTYPMCGGKCSGAAQKIMYLANDYWRKNKIRPQTSITYATGMSCIFGVPKYARALTQVAAARDIAVIYNAELNEVTKKEAHFSSSCGGTFTLPYNFLHVAPPMSPPVSLSKCTELVTERGYLDVDKHTLQHRRFPNVYGLGDCLCTPNSKTAAAVSGQSYVVEQNLAATMKGHEPPAKYNGYGACPMLTSFKTGILAEFLYNKEVCETFPFDQSVERRFFFLMKKNILPYVYWKRLITGKWNGPSTLRKIINPFKR